MHVNEEIKPETLTEDGTSFGGVVARARLVDGHREPVMVPEHRHRVVIAGDHPGVQGRAEEHRLLDPSQDAKPAR